MEEGVEDDELLDGEFEDLVDDVEAEDAEVESEEPDVAEHLRDAVEGSLRLKRLLTQPQEELEAGQKRRRIQSEEILVPKEKQELMDALQKAWRAEEDTVCRYVLSGLELDELKHMQESGYTPGKTFMGSKPSASQSWSTAEFVARYCQEWRESRLPGRLRIDIVDAFAHRCCLTHEQAGQLRKLNHKDLRFVLENYDGSGSLEECISDASTDLPADVAEDPTQAAPDRPGTLVMSRFNRLELIDPMADCAVFGDANLTFAKNLAQHRKDLGHAGRVVATTFEDIQTLRERYKEIDDSIQTLELCEAEVYHEVDCTRIALDKRFHGMEQKLGAVYYNFPHSGSVGGFYDSHPLVNWRHENLMRLLFRALRTYMQPGGIVKITSNAYAVGLRFSFILEGAMENEFIHAETLPFLEWHLHRYGRSYGDKRDVSRRPDEKNNESYRRQKEQADMVYCFSYKPSGKALEKQRIRMPPTLATLLACTDGPFKKVGSNREDKQKLAKRLHERFRKEVSGMHVG